MLISIVRSSLLSILLASQALAQENTCPVPLSPDKDALYISADRIRATQSQKFLLQGKVQVQQGQHYARSERLSYDGKSKRLKMKDNVQYTRCGPYAPLWFVSAEEASYNADNDKGIIKDSRLYFAGVPVFYFPRFRFSGDDDQRRSGLLAPTLSNSSDSGLAVSLPAYFNIAANKDALLVPRYFVKRGLQVNLLGRYLYELEHGSLEASWIDDRRYDDERYAYRFAHRADSSENFLLDAKLEYVSDDHYLEDFNDSFNTYGGSYIRSYLDSRWNYRGWDMHLELERLRRADYAADRFNQPYQKRPQFSLSKDWFLGNSPAKFHFLSETTDFTNKYRYLPNDDSVPVPEGIRQHNELRFEWPYWRPGFYFTPAVAVMHTHYKLSDRRNLRSTQRRTLPVLSARSGLVFERESASGRYRNTIEPELYYLYIPYRNQDSLPDFDTSESDFRYQRMFERNRFNGIDRIGDANRFTLGLSHRTFHRRTGVEAARFSVAKSFFLQDPRVQLPDNNAATNASLDINEKYNIAGEFSLNLNNKVRFLSSLIWNTKSNTTMRNTTSLSLYGAEQRSAHLVYRQKHQDFEQIGFGFNVPIDANWSIFSEVSYDLDSRNILNAFAGVRYNSCCWGLNIGVQRRLKNVQSPHGRISDGFLEYNNFIGVELNLQGFGKIGNDIDNLLNDSIFTY